MRASKPNESSLVPSIVKASQKQQLEKIRKQSPCMIHRYSVGNDLIFQPSSSATLMLILKKQLPCSSATLMLILKSPRREEKRRHSPLFILHIIMRLLLESR